MVNVILKKDYQGLDVDAQEGDRCTVATTTYFEGILGRNLQLSVDYKFY